MFASHPVPAADRASGLRARLTLWFFRRFFLLLLLGISLGETALLWWVSAPLELLPLVAYALAIPLLFALNTYLAASQRRRRPSPGAIGSLPTMYYAFAFASVFCGIFLALTSLTWIGSKALVGALAAQALTASHGAALGSDIDTGFRWLANLGITTISLSFVYGYSIGQLRLKVRRVPIRLQRAPAAWHGLTIAQISDIHVGENLEADQLQYFVDRVNELQADIICITGDIADSVRSDLDTYFPVLAGLRAKYGVFAILGNHDHYAGPERVVAALQRHTSFTVLRDASVEIDVRGHPLAVVGLDDRGQDWARGLHHVPALDQTLAVLPPETRTLLLCHRPDPFPHAARAGVGLMLSGHTHGGQIGMPWINGRTRNLAQFVTAFDRGLFEIDRSYLYVNCGLGVTGQRIRLCTPREITILEIDSAGRTGES